METNTVNITIVLKGRAQPAKQSGGGEGGAGRDPNQAMTASIVLCSKGNVWGTYIIVKNRRKHNICQKTTIVKHDNCQNSKIGKTVKHV